jgi:hypothetical protein
MQSLKNKNPQEGTLKLIDELTKVNTKNPSTEERIKND